MRSSCSCLFSLGAACCFAAALEPTPSNPLQEQADRFLALANASYHALTKVTQEALWVAATDVTPAHDAASETASKAFAAFNGNPALIAEARALLARRTELTDLSARQLERLLLNAAEGPMTNPPLVAARVAAETRQASALNGYGFTFKGQPITANAIDRLLNTSRDLAERRAVWEASKEIGPALKPGLVTLQPLRNGVARELGYPDYFALQAAAYGLNAAELLQLNDDFLRALRPLYRQLHTWAKYELAQRYNQPVPRRIPAHWIDNRWGQEWSGLVAAADFDPYFQGRSPEWIVQTAERFFRGLGFPALPASFWERSDLYPVPTGHPRKKNAHASCWHIDLDFDIRSLMSIEPNAQWFGTAHHELGHGFYQASYARPEVPALLRTSANPGFHEGIAEIGGMACWQEPYLRQVGILPASATIDPVALLLNDALTNGVAFLFFASGTMTHWEADVYAGNLPPEQWNGRWWRYVRDFQGLEPPADRGEEWCDAASKTHVNDVPCYYPNYAFATVLKFQLNDHIARHLLHQPPQTCNYAGNAAVGEFLRSLMAKGATEDWRTVLQQATGEPLSTRAMVDYYAPLLRWLEAQNRGRPIGWD